LAQDTHAPQPVRCDIEDVSATLSARTQLNIFLKVHAYRSDTVEVHRMFSGRLRREIVALLCLKAGALLAIYQFFFAPLTHPEPDGRSMRAHLLSEGER
jgi:hypothetical protein